jgi:hypothetical protein
MVTAAVALEEEVVAQEVVAAVVAEGDNQPHLLANYPEQSQNY